jgi:hypothetical protein
MDLTKNHGLVSQLLYEQLKSWHVGHVPWTEYDYPA